MPIICTLTFSVTELHGKVLKREKKCILAALLRIRQIPLFILSLEEELRVLQSDFLVLLPTYSDQAMSAYCHIARNSPFITAVQLYAT